MLSVVMRISFVHKGSTRLQGLGHELLSVVLMNPGGRHGSRIRTQSMLVLAEKAPVSLRVPLLA